jgi:GNAT superfamily N-acetyltransferase
MVQLRRATPRDAEELTRLRGVMASALGIDASDHRWRAACLRDLRRRLGDDAHTVAYVVDRDPATPGLLAACGVGLIRQEMPAPHRPDGRIGSVVSVCTDEEFRGRGYATAIVTRLLDWFTEQGVARVDLNASPFGVEVYRRLGFAEPPNTALTWRLPAR